MKILVTGAAGFIGSRLVEYLVARGHEVVGIDNLNNYYDPRLKVARLARTGIKTPSDEMITDIPCAGSCRETVAYPYFPRGKEIKSTLYPRYRFFRMDITSTEEMDRLFLSEKFEVVMNLAAQAGVRYSIENPMAYVHTNVTGFMNLLECARKYSVKHLVYASSSSVYGGNDKVPFEETDRVDSPVSIYAATKKSNELFAHVYSKLYNLPTTGLRFFTVYGPWGRPDMAPMLFADAIVKGNPIKIFNNGDMLRDFTYIDDIVEGVARIIEGKPSDKPLPVEIYNIGCGNPVKLMDFISTLEKALGIEAQKEYLPMQPGDVYQTYSDSSALHNKTGFVPRVALEDGVIKTVRWFRDFYGAQQKNKG